MERTNVSTPGPRLTDSAVGCEDYNRVHPGIFFLLLRFPWRAIVCWFSCFDRCQHERNLLHSLDLPRETDVRMDIGSEDVLL